jgi:hypothetical protein
LKLAKMADDKAIDATARSKVHDVAYTMAIQIYNIYCDAVVEILKDRASRFSSDRRQAEDRFIGNRKNWTRGRLNAYNPKDFERVAEEKDS